MKNIFFIIFFEVFTRRGLDVVKPYVISKHNMGKRADNTTGIGVYRNEDYKAYKLKLNPLARGFVDLNVTGRLRNEMYLDIKGADIENATFEIKSRVSYFNKNKAKYKQPFVTNFEKDDEGRNKIFVSLYDELKNNLYEKMNDELYDIFKKVF